MKILDNMDYCYGCEACANACPVNAIKMTESNEGFLYPEIDDSLCISCGACQRTCPAINRKYENDKQPMVYAAMASDDIREKSASGGIFTLLAENVIGKGGYACGCAFDDDFLGAHSLMVDNLKDIDKLRRSKYIQSRNGDIYKQIEKRLKEDRYVLFTGTPCQCAALKAYLKKPYEKLIVVDLICHGTPSPKAWRAFIDEIGNGRKIEDVNFRYKGLIGWSATTYVRFDDGNEYIKIFKDDPFEQASSKNLISRRSCSTCQFARVPRQGDLTIGDFWGIKKELNDKRGTSAMMVNTEKGRALVEEINQQWGFKLLEEISFYESFGRKNANVYRAPHAAPGRGDFFEALSNGSPFSKALNDSKSKKYDAVLLSIWYAANYGSLMTNFALYKTLEDKGYNCIFADIPDHLWPKSINHRHPLFVTRRFAYKHFKLTGKYKDRTDLKKLNAMADTFIVGSDQIWNYSLCKTADTFFFLDFVEGYKKKIAYGTSFGHDTFRGSEENRKKAGFYLERFDAISVRENYAVDLCKNQFELEATEVLDPVFLCDKKHYESCVNESSLNKCPPEGKYVLAYILDPDEEKQIAIENVAKRLDAEIICIPNAHVDEVMRKNWRLPIKENIDMEDWLYYFKNAEMVVTDSFHGTCFSIIFERPFIAIGNKRRGIARFGSLLGKMGLTDKLIYSPNEIEKNDELFAQIDYEAVNQRLDSLRRESMAWLENALGKKPSPALLTDYDLLDKRLDEMQAKIDRLTKELENVKAEKVCLNQDNADLTVDLPETETKKSFWQKMKDKKAKK
ncbi:MAG: polysaccharide pyruvyl transferase family protein [Clostridia bacterium]|nr:polysaccharide pyruvyl transferase family protein [Clostridia bacterium]